MAPFFLIAGFDTDDLNGVTHRFQLDSGYPPQRWPDCLVIQCKWQASPGSVEEKYPFEVLSIQLNEFNTIIVLDGGGYSKGAEMWLRSQAGKNKLLHVHNLGEISRFHSQGRL